jgi:RNA polymerase sigma-70 factor (ECF subfamily)
MRLSDGGTTSPALLNRLGDWRDDAAWSEFVDRYRPLVELWCRRMRLDSETSDELCQRIWIDLAHRMSSFQYDPSRRFRGWLRRLYYSRAVDLLRERQAHPVRSLDEEPTDPFSVAAAGDFDDEGESAARLPVLLRLGTQVHDTVKRQVEPQTWTAFWSIAVEGRSIRETADLLRMTYAAAFAAHKRVVARLKAEGAHVLRQTGRSALAARRDER